MDQADDTAARMKETDEQLHEQYEHLQAQALVGTLSPAEQAELDKLRARFEQSDNQAV